MHASPHALIDALYTGINALDTTSLRALFVPGTTLVRVGPPLSVLSFDAWATGLPTVFTENEEVELSRLVALHGDLAHVTSRFLIRHRATQAPVRAGTNSLTLAHGAEGWRLAAAVWVADPS